jgi:hypothetical protein
MSLENQEILAVSEEGRKTTFFVVEQLRFCQDANLPNHLIPCGFQCGSLRK